MKLEISIPDELVYAWEAAGEELQAKVEAFVQRESVRLRHVIRCRPRAKELKPSGKVLAVGDKLLKVYLKKLELYDGKLPDWLAEQYAEVQLAMKGNDLAKLELLWNQQLWNNKPKG